MKKDIEEIKIILAEIQQRIMYIEEYQRRQSQRQSQRQRQTTSQRQSQRQSQTLQGMERTEKEDPVTIQWQGPYNH